MTQKIASKICDKIKRKLKMKVKLAKHFSKNKLAFMNQNQDYISMKPFNEGSFDYFSQ